MLEDNADEVEYYEVTISYPRFRKNKGVIVHLEDIRAADSIQIEFDFNADAWVIKQDRVSFNDVISVVIEKETVAMLSAFNYGR